MEYRTLGKTGLEVSVLSYGASPLGSNFRKIREADGIKTVHTVLDLGINLIDCSPHYGLTVAETVLGKALKTIKRDDYYLATKVGRWGEEFDFSPARIVKSVDESLQRLGVDYLDIYQLHDIEYVDIDAMINPALATLKELQQQGKIRFFGITGYPPEIFSRVIEQHQSDVDTILSYGNYTLVNRRLEPLLPMLKKKNIGVINASVLGMGFFTERGAPDWWDYPQDLRDACKRVVDYSKERGKNLAQLAIKFATSNTDIASTLVGTANPENLQKNVAWVEHPLDVEFLAEVEAMLSSVMNGKIIIGREENNE